jgi:hypothetical protein
MRHAIGTLVGAGVGGVIGWVVAAAGFGQMGVMAKSAWPASSSGSRSVPLWVPRSGGS